MPTDTYRRGLELLEKLHGGQAGAAMVEEMKDICPDFATMTIEWSIAGIMARPGLDLLTREGATRQQMIEVILQLTFYAGGPAVRNALVVIPDVYGPAKSG